MHRVNAQRGFMQPRVKRRNRRLFSAKRLTPEQCVRRMTYDQFDAAFTSVYWEMEADELDGFGRRPPDRIVYYAAMGRRLVCENGIWT